MKDNNNIFLIELATKKIIEDCELLFSFNFSYPQISNFHNDFQKYYYFQFQKKYFQKINNWIHLLKITGTITLIVDFEIKEDIIFYKLEFKFNYYPCKNFENEKFEKSLIKKYSKIFDKTFKKFDFRKVE